MRYFLIIFLFACVATVSILGFRGSKSTETPVYLFPDMDDQAKYKPQGRNDFFVNQMNNRLPVQGTVIRGSGLDYKDTFSDEYEYAVALNEALYTGKDAKGEFLKEFPIPVTHELIELGQKKYNTFCYVCHGLGGNGNGITKSYGMIATPCFHRDDKFKKMPYGEFFNTITHGKGQMNSYADKLTPEERWAVILYIQALLRSQNARLQDVPEQFRANLQEFR